MARICNIQPAYVTYSPYIQNGEKLCPKSSDGYCKNDSFNYDLDEILRYKYENCFANDGKRVRWTDSFEMLKIFTRYAIEQPGNWLSPGGKYKKFISSNSDLIFTWNYELGSLSFKGEMGDRLKELFITLCIRRGKAYRLNVQALSLWL